ncbi:MAG: type pantothenate kinase [Pseudomonadota bacterium]|nr:type pantothenate kinase [Pseudomonadota bacterium]
MSTRRVLIDAGNTRLKWALTEGERWHAHGSLDYSDLSALAPLLAKADASYIASVARAQHENLITRLLAPGVVTPIWLQAEARFLDLRNSYDNPRQLGVDRWMGLIGARQRTQAATLVVSVGTAMTVDALSTEGVFLGGLIVPGRAMMQQALRQGTARVADVAGAWQDFPRTTADAVESGIVAALCGTIQQQHARLAEMAGGSPHCFLTGGDAETLLPHLSVAVEHVPALVLEGVDRVAKEGKTE